MEEPLYSENEHKVLVGFKCSPFLKSMLCMQADKLGVTLSSHIETIVLTQEHHSIEIANLTEHINNLIELIASYETPFLKELFDLYKGTEVSFTNSAGKAETIIIKQIIDVFTVVINSFQIIK